MSGAERTAAEKLLILPKCSWKTGDLLTAKRGTWSPPFGKHGIILTKIFHLSKLHFCCVGCCRGPAKASSPTEWTTFCKSWASPMLEQQFPSGCSVASRTRSTRFCPCWCSVWLASWKTTQCLRSKEGKVQRSNVIRFIPCCDKYVLNRRVNKNQIYLYHVRVCWFHFIIFIAIFIFNHIQFVFCILLVLHCFIICWWLVQIMKLTMAAICDCIGLNLNNKQKYW